MNILSLFTKIRAFVLDVDGVLTDGTILLLDDGQQARRMHIRDGYALQLAIKKGYKVLVISGAESASVITRLNRLGIMDVHTGVTNKSAILAEYVSKHQLDLDEVLFMGDDMPDLEVMKMAGLPCCPSDAAPEILAISRYISPKAGGQGAVRDVIEKTLKLNNHWADDGSIAAR